MPVVQTVIFTIVCAMVRLNDSDLGRLAMCSSRAREMCKGKLLARKKSWRLARAFQLMCNIHSKLEFRFADYEHCLKAMFPVPAMVWNRETNQCVWLSKPSQDLAERIVTVWIDGDAACLVVLIQEIRRNTESERTTVIRADVFVIEPTLTGAIDGSFVCDVERSAKLATSKIESVQDLIRVMGSKYFQEKFCVVFDQQGVSYDPNASA